nr:uncharacterized protein LOC128685580 [Cherax quadricarinatus]
MDSLVGGAGGCVLVQDLTEALQVGQVSRLGADSGPYRCNVCNQNLASKYSIKTHLNTQKHQNKFVSPQTPSFPARPATLTLVSPQAPSLPARPATLTLVSPQAPSLPARPATLTLVSPQAPSLPARPATHNTFTQQSSQIFSNTKHCLHLSGKFFDSGSGQLVQDLTEAVQVGQVTQLGDEKGPYRCNVCDQNLASKTSIKTHLTTQKHQNKVGGAGVGGAGVGGVGVGGAGVGGAGVGGAGVGGAGVRGTGVGGAGGWQLVQDLTEAVQVGQVTQLGDEKGPYRCNVCDQKLASKTSIKTHLTTQKHQNKVKVSGTGVGVAGVGGAGVGVEGVGGAGVDVAGVGGAGGRQQVDELTEALQAGQVTMIETENGPYCCNVCEQNLASKASIRSHLCTQKHQKMLDLRALLCPESVQQGPVMTNTPQQPVQQGPVMTNTPQQLLQQEDEVVTEALAAGHVNLMSDGVRYRCNMCKRFFVSPASLRSHVRSLKHQIKILMDEEDKQECGTPRSVSNGSVIETDDKSSPYWCRKCCQPINNIISLKKHRSCIKVTRVNQSSDLKLDEFGSYTVRSIPRGHVYVFNYKFPPPYQRAGAEHDSTNIREIFTELGYKVFIHEDLTKKQTLDTIKDIRKDPKLHNVDSFIAFFLSHGENAYEFQTYDKKRLELKNLRSEFSDTKCPQLKKKPKIFMANYCRGRSIEKVDFDDKRVEVTQDIVTIHATTEGVMALRSHDKGTIFIKCLCDVLRDIKGTIDLRTIYGRLYLSMMRCGGTKPMWEDVGFRNFYFQVTRVNQSSDLKLDEFGSYTVRSIPRGHVYVFNYKFPPPYQRAGAEHDSTNIREIFTELGYKVFIHEDLTKKQTLDTIKDIQKDPKLHNVDSFIAFFLSHGENAYEFQTYDKKRLELKNLRSEFSSTKCPQLKKKPKIFMANYCRGRSIEKVDFDDKRVEVTQDIVTIHATTEGVMALRSRDKGTIFIKCLCDVLRDIKGTIDLRTIYGRLYLSMMRCGGTKPMWEDVGFRNFYFQR